MDGIKKLIQYQQPFLGSFSGPVGSGRAVWLLTLIKEAYTPAPDNIIGQLTDILSEHPKVVWLSGSRVLSDQMHLLVQKKFPELLPFFSTEVYTMAKFSRLLPSLKNTIIIVDESCIKGDPNLVAGKAREIQALVRLYLNDPKNTLLIESQHGNTVLNHAAHVLVRFVDGKFQEEKNLLYP